MVYNPGENVLGGGGCGDRGQGTIYHKAIFNDGDVAFDHNVPFNVQF
jgi:hypothetical protein